MPIGGIVSRLARKVAGESAEQVLKATPKRGATRVTAEQELSRSARMRRARQMGFDTKTTYYHGTSNSFDEFSKDKLGSLTKAVSAKEGFFFTVSPRTAHDYARMSKENSPNFAPALQTYRDSLEHAKEYYPKDLKSQKLLQDEIDKLIKESEAQSGENIIPVKLKFDNPKIVDMDYTSYADYNRPRLGEEIRKAKAEGYDAVIFRNFSDSIKDPRSMNPDDLLYASEENDFLKHFVDKVLKAKNLDKQFLNSTERFYQVENALTNISYIYSRLKSAEKDGVKVNFPDLGMSNRTFLKRYEEFAKEYGGLDYADQIVVFEPNQIRSVNAKFDPKDAASGNLMAGIGATAVGSTALMTLGAEKE